jgi:thiamine biosynthesis lipoprotein
MADRVTRCRPLLGTFVEVTAECDRAAESAFEAIAEVHGLMSAHDPDSDVSRINRLAHRQPVEVHALTACALERAVHWAKQSEGVFDIVRAGKIAIDRGLLPVHDGQPAPQAGHWTWLEICGSSVRLLKAACVDLGGIAKGFAVDRAIAAMKAVGAKYGLVNAGGDIAGFGPQSWPVQVVQPESRRAIANVAVENGAVATSSLLPDGSAGHLFGREDALLSATVSAPNATDADALTKVVLSGSAAAARCLAIAGAQAFVLRRDGSIAPVEVERRAA